MQVKLTILSTHHTVGPGHSLNYENCSPQCEWACLVKNSIVCIDVKAVPAIMNFEEVRDDRECEWIAKTVQHRYPSRILEIGMISAYTLWFS